METQELPVSTITYEQFAAKYDILDVTDNDVVMVALKEKSLPTPSDLTELGSSMPTRYSFIDRQDYNPQLRGREGLVAYDKMRRNDGQVKMSLRYVKTPILAGRWHVEPFDESKRSEKIAKYIWKNFTQTMTCSWPQVLLECLLMLDFGFYMFEKVRVIEDGLVKFQKFAPKHVMDLYEWEYDAHGGPLAAWFYGFRGLPGAVKIPIDKLLVFTNDKEGGDMMGISTLRPSYKHHFFKDTLYRIDAIQKERHGIGIPIIKLPAIFSPKDKALANEIGANLRTNERSHIVLPPFWELEFVKLEGQPVNAIESIEHHDKMIARNVMLDFGKDDDKLALKNAQFIAELIKDVFNKWAIPEICKWNWGVEDFPQLMVNRIGDTTDFRIYSFALRNLIGAGVIKPDDRLEAHTRELMNLPKADPSTAREQPQKQNPGGAVNNQTVAGKPRQSTAQNMQINTGSSKVGRDGGSNK